MPGGSREVLQRGGMPQGSVWSTMHYPIPRGRCMQTTGIVSVCSCLRFMAHPLKANTSFECDGCGHHASFHKMKSHEPEVEEALEAAFAAAAEERKVVIVEDTDDDDDDDDSTVNGDARNSDSRRRIESAGSSRSTSRKRKNGEGSSSQGGVGGGDPLAGVAGKRPKVARNTRLT